MVPRFKNIYILVFGRSCLEIRGVVGHVKVVNNLFYKLFTCSQAFNALSADVTAAPTPHSPHW